MSNKLVKDKYTIKDFCKKYNETNIEQTKAALIEKIMNPHYVPYEMKITICEKIIESSYYKKNNDGVKKFHVNSPAQYMLYCLWMVKQYTNLEVNFNDALGEFNLLNEHSMLDIIYSNIPEKELKEFRMILDMVENDTLQNEYETHAFISNQVERFGELFGHVAEPALQRLAEVIESIDEKKVKNIISELKRSDFVKVLNGKIKLN